jgi:hypothetical protein
MHADRIRQPPLGHGYRARPSEENARDSERETAGKRKKGREREREREGQVAMKRKKVAMRGRYPLLLVPPLLVLLVLLSVWSDLSGGDRQTEREGERDRDTERERERERERNTLKIDHRAERRCRTVAIFPISLSFLSLFLSFFERFYKRIALCKNFYRDEKESDGQKSEEREKREERERDVSTTCARPRPFFFSSLLSLSTSLSIPYISLIWHTYSSFKGSCHSRSFGVRTKEEEEEEKID